MRSIPHNLIADKTYCVNYLVYSNNNNARSFMYIAVRQDNMPEFQSAIRQGNFDAEDYGFILESGTGEASANIKNKMSMLYNCNHESGLKVLDYNPEA
jgi:hypothetical protein